LLKIYFYMYLYLLFYFFFFCNPGCPGQLTRTTTNLRTHWTPCKPSRQVRHRGGDRRARWGSNPGDRGNETLPLPLGHKPRWIRIFDLECDGSSCSVHIYLALERNWCIHAREIHAVNLLFSFFYFRWLLIKQLDR
jgi:hypothetical protein